MAKIKIKNREGGVAIIFSVLLIGVILAIVLTLSAIFIPKIRASAEVKKSTAAAYAAESAIEWCLYIKINTPPSPTPSPPVMSNGATYTNGLTGGPLSASDCLSIPIRTLGTFQGVTRAFEISF